jgi:glucosamine kinase
VGVVQQRAAQAPWRVGIDGGGSGTRARLQTRSGNVVGQGAAGPSGLSQGVEQAWRHVQAAVAAAFGDAGLALPPPAEVALGLGLAGAGVPSQHAAFLAQDPGYACCVLDTDAATLLLGAHAGQPGIVVAAGTGSVAARRDAAGNVQQAGGWGFPVGDEGSGAWLGLRAMQAAQSALDGRQPRGALAERVLQSTAPDGTGVLAWCASAGQHAYAQLAPLVFDAAEQGDPPAELLLEAAAAEIGRLARALQRHPDPLPVVVAGSIGLRLQPRWPAALRAQAVAAAGDGCDGALRLLGLALDEAGLR